LDSAEYAAQLNQVKELGSINSTTRSRTDRNCQVLGGWSGHLYPGHWNQIAELVSLAQGNTLSENARLFALLNIAELMQQCCLGCQIWYDFWRPVTAIEADTDGNPDTIADPNWEPLLVLRHF